MFRIKTPATSANLGPGFDLLGIALNLFNEFEIVETNHFKFVNFQYRYANEHNLIIKAYKEVFTYLNLKIIPIEIKQIKNDIPNSRGLGSSASCIACGIVAANTILNKPLNKKELLKIASQLEGHPDNVAPCLFGGLIACREFRQEISYYNYPVSKKLRIYLLIPDFKLKTSEARAVLPNKINHHDSVKNSANLLFLLQALKAENQEVLNEVIVDYLHSNYRQKLIAEYQEIRELFKDKAVTISGAGPSILVLSYQKIQVSQIRKQVKVLKNKWEIKELTVNYQGTEVEKI